LETDMKNHNIHIFGKKKEGFGRFNVIFSLLTLYYM